MKAKLIGGFVLVAAVGVAIAVFALLSSLNSLVAQAIEKHGSEATGTEVGVTGVDISLKEGRGAIGGLHIASPDGFSSANAFSLDQIEIDLDLGSVRKDPIVVESVSIRAPRVHAEFSRDGGSNLDAIRKHLSGSAAGSPSGGSGGGGAASEKKIVIRSFVFEKGEITVDASALGVDRRTIALPEIRLHDVGGTDGGTPNELAREILGAVLQRATREIAGSEVQKFIHEKLGEPIKEGAKKLLDALKN